GYYDPFRSSLGPKDRYSVMTGERLCDGHANLGTGHKNYKVQTGPDH
ncbi:22854_t:CDS:2, partial [Racocetra persica]